MSIPYSLHTPKSSLFSFIGDKKEVRPKVRPKRCRRRQPRPNTSPKSRTTPRIEKHILQDEYNKAVNTNQKLLRQLLKVGGIVSKSRDQTLKKLQQSRNDYKKAIADIKKMKNKLDKCQKDLLLCNEKLTTEQRNNLSERNLIVEGQTKHEQLLKQNNSLKKQISELENVISEWEQFRIDMEQKQEQIVQDQVQEYRIQIDKELKQCQKEKQKQIFYKLQLLQEKNNLQKKYLKLQNEK